MRSLKIKIAVFSIAIAMAVFLGNGCSSLSKTQKGAAIGAGAGGTIGALIGKAAGNTALGAIIGGAIGGTAGAYIGKTIDRKTIVLKPPIPGATLTRQGDGTMVKFDTGLLFDAGKSDLTPISVTNLQNLATTLQNNPKVNVAITGYTDSLEIHTYNTDLSVQRAEAVKTYMVANGINGLRLTTLGKVMPGPKTDNTTDTGRPQDRRVEIVIAATEPEKSASR